MNFVDNWLDETYFRFRKKKSTDAAPSPVSVADWGFFRHAIHLSVADVFNANYAPRCKLFNIDYLFPLTFTISREFFKILPMLVDSA